MGEGSSGADRRTLSSFPTNGRSGGDESGSGDQGECQGPSGSSKGILYRHFRISGLLKHSKLKVAAAYYDITSGIVSY